MYKSNYYCDKCGQRLDWKGSDINERSDDMFELKVTGIIINFLIALYAMVKAHRAAVENNISFTVFYSAMYVVYLIGMWNCT